MTRSPLSRMGNTLALCSRLADCAWFPGTSGRPCPFPAGAEVQQHSGMETAVLPGPRGQAKRQFSCRKDLGLGRECLSLMAPRARKLAERSRAQGEPSPSTRRPAGSTTAGWGSSARTGFSARSPGASAMRPPRFAAARPPLAPAPVGKALGPDLERPFGRRGPPQTSAAQAGEGVALRRCDDRRLLYGREVRDERVGSFREPPA